MYWSVTMDSSSGISCSMISGLFGINEKYSNCPLSDRERGSG